MVNIALSFVIYTNIYFNLGLTFIVNITLKNPLELIYLQQIKDIKDLCILGNTFFIITLVLIS